MAVLCHWLLRLSGIAGVVASPNLAAASALRDCRSEPMPARVECETAKGSRAVNIHASTPCLPLAANAFVPRGHWVALAFCIQMPVLSRVYSYNVWRKIFVAWKRRQLSGEGLVRWRVSMLANVSFRVVRVGFPHD